MRHIVERLERLIIDQIKEKVLTQECLEELVNEELDSQRAEVLTWPW